MDFSPALDLGRSAAFHASLSSALPLSEDFPMPARCDRLPLLTASPGTSRELVVHRFGQAGARPKVYLQAALPADETPGMLVLHHLYGVLEEAERRGSVAGIGRGACRDRVGTYVKDTGG